MQWYKLDTSERIDLERTLFSGQIFSFKKTGTDTYTGVIEGSIITFKQVGDAVHYRFHTDIHNTLARFFTLDINYRSLIEKWNATQSHFRFEYTGLRLLRCDPVETIFSFICSSNNNIKRITGMVNYLFTKGEFLGEVDGAMFYRFPAPEKLADIGDELRNMRFGYRAKYVCATAAKIVRQAIDTTMDYDQVNALLRSFDGIGQKVSDCICLTSFSHLHVVPIDTHIFRVSKQVFGLPYKLSKSTSEDIKERYAELFGEYAGIAQLFIFKQSLDRKGTRNTGA